MKTLADAWNWYKHTAHQVTLMRRLANQYWLELPWEGRLDKDDHFRHVMNTAVEAEADFSLFHLDDLAILVLFSVFEALIREQVLDELKGEIPHLRHPALRKAGQETLQKIEEGSFFQVLEPFKVFDVSMVEQVNQVRRYRNWVAHGRRGERPINLTPPMAYDRLLRFLDLLNRPEGKAGVP